MENNYLNTITNEIYSNIIPYTVQLFKIDSTKEPVEIYPLGTGTLLHINGNHYMCTAAHVYHDEDIIKIGVSFDETFYILQGEITYLSANHSIENNNGDIAICKLSEEVANDLKEKYNFLPWKRIMLNHILEEQPRYLMKGYPASKTKKRYVQRTIETQAFHFLTCGITETKKYEKLNLYQDVNYLVDFHINKLYNFINDCKQTAPRPRGNSGMGIWYWNGSKSYLIGIMTGYNNEEAVFIGTRIDLVTELIRQRFDNSILPTEVIKPKFYK